ncbi:hypothetical protein B0H16DRAFT_1515502 [Mycena metata]|uniref:Uncharacterized protein n=1 Tax=Mycena metata TaxID=1033252 RepID=A0AAD7JRH3_9AGAR|nr:hypothetical protein B0H16DRAFT_1515502 [Mycena metata]
MLINPSAQGKAQAEIGSVTEGKSLPTFVDQDRMPFVAALVQGGRKVGRECINSGDPSLQSVAPFGEQAPPVFSDVCPVSGCAKF